MLQNANYRKQMGRRTRGTTKICHAVICALWDCFFCMILGVLGNYDKKQPKISITNPKIFYFFSGLL